MNASLIAFCLLACSSEGAPPGTASKPSIEGTWSCVAEREGRTRTVSVAFLADGNFTFKEHEKGGQFELSAVNKGTWRLSGNKLDMFASSSEGLGATDMVGGESFPESFPVAIKLGADTLEGVTSRCTLKRDAGG